MNNSNNWPLVDPFDDGIRPAGAPDACFYCKQKVGQPHKRDCVMVKKLVRFRCSDGTDVDIDDVPHSWSRKYIEENADLWGLCDAEYLGVVDETPRRELTDF